MTFDEALIKRDETRMRRQKAKEVLENKFGTDHADGAMINAIQNAEYDWGYWDAVITIMKNCGMKEISEKAVR